jgi:hypothetical protein
MMRRGLIISLALHAAVLLAALVVLPNPDAFKVAPQQTVMVDISKIGDVAKMKAQAPEAQKAEKPAPKEAPPTPKADPQPKVAEKEVKAAREPAPAPEPEPPKKEPPKKEPPKPEEPKPLDPDPLKDLIKKTEDKPKPPEKPAEKPVEKKLAEKPPEKKKPKLNPGEIQDLLNKINDESAAPQQQASLTGQPAQGEQQTQGTDNEMVATLIDLLASNLEKCWDKPPGSEESNVHVVVRFALTPEGMVEGQPQVMNNSDHPLFAAMARAAVDAVYTCQPFSFLPRDKYDLWRENTSDFDPKHKAGSVM